MYVIPGHVHSNTEATNSAYSPEHLHVKALIGGLGTLLGSREAESYDRAYLDELTMRYYTARNRLDILTYLAAPLSPPSSPESSTTNSIAC